MKHINKLIIPLFFIIILSTCVLAQAVDDTQAMRDLQDRLERFKAEIIKAVNDANTKNQNTTSAFIDQNFRVLDKRIDDFFSNSKREIAIIMVAGFLVAFTLSQIIRLKIEQRQRKALMKKALDLESACQRLEKDAIQLTAKVRQLKSLDDQYSQELKSITKRQPFISLKMVLVSIVTLLLGVIATYILMGGR